MARKCMYEYTHQRESYVALLAVEGGIRIYCCYITESDDMDGATTKKFIHLVRHGKYLGSPVGEVLSPIGIRQAELTGGRLQQLVSQGIPREGWLASCTRALLGQYIQQALLPNTFPTFPCKRQNFFVEKTHQVQLR